MFNSNADFRFEIVEHIATLSESHGTSKELNRVSFNGAPAKLDLRGWKDEGGTRKMLKGITLTDAEAEALRKALNRL